MPRTLPQAPQGPAHSQQARLQDVDLVDFLRRGHRHEPVRFGLYAHSQRLALAGSELLAVIESGDVEVRRQDHRRRHHRPGQASASGLVEPGLGQVGMYASFHAAKLPKFS